MIVIFPAGAEPDAHITCVLLPRNWSMSMFFPKVISGEGTLLDTLNKTAGASTLYQQKYHRSGSL